MKYLSAYYTDQGKRKGMNQDSLLISQAKYCGQNILLAAVCDGMGGLKKGELASAEVIRSFAEGFRENFGALAVQEEFEDALYDSWELLVQKVHRKLWDYGQLHGIRVGTTLTAMLFWQENYYIAHVGDTRIYEIREQVTQLTRDQILSQLDTEHGKAECAEKKNILLQGIGCSSLIRPAYYSGKTEEDTVYLLCSDGFRHKISNQELQEKFAPEKCANENRLSEQVCNAARLVMDRGEKDNLSAILIRTVGEEKDCDDSGGDDIVKEFTVEKEMILSQAGEVDGNVVG